jgi:membrane protein DedA with SNARE-associated domain
MDLAQVLDLLRKTDLPQLLELIRQHGDLAYRFMFIFAANNTLLMVLFAGYAAGMGAFDWATLIWVCWAGSFAGDAVRFWIGRRFGTGWLKSFPRIERWVLHVTAASRASPAAFRGCRARLSWR